MKYIRKAEPRDISRIAEILIFTKRMHYRHIFQDDTVSFGKMQVVPLACEYESDLKRLGHIWVYDDEFVKGMIHIENGEIAELYVEHFFQGAGIGRKLVEFAVREFDADYLWVLEKNEQAIRFYQRCGFERTNERKLNEGTPEYVVKMCRA